MAEAFGIAAGAAGFVSLLGQFVGAANTLREIRRYAGKAPDNLDAVVKDLEFLVGIMSSVAGRSHQQQDAFLQHCKTSCDRVADHLRQLEEKISPLRGAQQRGKKREKLRILFEMRDWREDIGNLQRSLEKAKTECLLYHVHKIENMMGGLNDFVLANINNPHMLASSDASVRDQSEPTASSAPQTSRTQCGISEVTRDAAHPLQRAVRPKRHRSCTVRHCSCRCHRRAGINRRFWALDYNPLAVLRENCDRAECNATEYGFSFRVALTQLGINWSLAIGLQVQMAAGRVGLRPNLQMERTVPYTSPGFELIWRCSHNLISYEEAQQGLVDLYRSDPTFKNHVAPDGRSYIEFLLCYPWRFTRRSRQFYLLKLLMKEFGITRGLETTRFLISCVKWIDEAQHLELLYVLIELGFDTTAADWPSSHDWPQPCSPGWISEETTVDPFYIEYLKILSKDNQGYGGTSPLHDAVLCGPLDEVPRWISHSGANGRNFLGQTPVHCAVSRFDCLELLIKHRHIDLDQADNYGITPLMYAAAMGQEESVIALLEAGADPYASDDRFGRTLLHYAAARGHSGLIIRVLCYFEGIDKQAAQFWAKVVTGFYCVAYLDYLGEGRVPFRQLLAKCGDVNFTIADENVQGNTLLHHVRTVSNVEALLENQFRLIDHRNSAGQSALMTLSMGEQSTGITRKLLEEGADLNLRDNRGRSAIRHVLSRLGDGKAYHLKETLHLLNIYLAHGADVLAGDGCRCPCSPSGGCYPSASLGRRVGSFTTLTDFHLPIWSFEWLSMLSEHRGEIEAKSVLLSFNRRAKYDQLGMTHVCCQRHLTIWGICSFLTEKKKLSPEEIENILEEESDSYRTLEREMAQIADRDYEFLLDYWISHINDSLERARVERIHHEKSRAKNSKNIAGKASRKSFTVDRREDRFINHSICNHSICVDIPVQDPDKDAISQVTKYVLWLEHEYHAAQASQNVDELPRDRDRDGWYARRTSWLCRLLSGLGIQTAKVTECMRSHSQRKLQHASPEEYELGMVEIEEKVRHFGQALASGGNI